MLSALVLSALVLVVALTRGFDTVQWLPASSASDEPDHVLPSANSESGNSPGTAERVAVKGENHLGPPAENEVRVVLNGATLPADWIARVGDKHMKRSGSEPITVVDPSLPMQVSGFWRGRSFFCVNVAAYGETRVDVKEAWELELRAPGAVECKAWACYCSILPLEGKRNFAVDVIAFGDDGTIVQHIAMDEARRFVVRVPGHPLFLLDTTAVPSTPWSTHCIRIPLGVASPIGGRVTDVSGNPVSDAQVRITRLFPERWGNGDYMVLDELHALAMGGFIATIRTGQDGHFRLDEVGPDVGQPFLAELVGGARRVISPTGIVRTTAGGTWVEMVVQ